MFFTENVLRSYMKETKLKLKLTCFAILSLSIQSLQKVNQNSALLFPSNIMSKQNRDPSS